MSIPLWAHAYQNYILTSKGSSPSQAAYAAKLKKKAEGTNPAAIIEALKQGRNKGASTKRGRRYQSIIVLPVEEMSEEDLQYVLDYASDSEDIEMDGQNYMMGDIRPQLYELLNKDMEPAPQVIPDVRAPLESNAIERIDTSIGVDKGFKRIDSRIETDNYGLTLNNEFISSDLKTEQEFECYEELIR